MAFFECNFFSESLGMAVSANVILPQPTRGQIGMKGIGSADGCPVLYLLHGYSDDHSIWMRRTSIERYAAQYGIAVVMPNAHRSFYNNLVCGINYWTYISAELPEIIGAFFKFSRKREDTFAAGLSMGGFGALKLGLNMPEKYVAVAGLSSVIKPLEINLGGDRRKEFENTFGDPSTFQGSQNDLYFKFDEAKRNNIELPRIFIGCGTEDFLYNDNLKFKAHMEQHDFPFTYMEGPGGHGWDFWDKYIQDVLKWMFPER